MIDRTCEQCGAAFKTWPSTVRRGSGKYCSRECASEGRRGRTIAPRVTFACETCGQDVTMTRAEFDWRAGVQVGPPRFCSQSCAGRSPETMDRIRSLAGGNAAALVREAKSEAGRARRRETVKRLMADPVWKARWLEGIRRRSDDPAWKAAAQFQPGEQHPNYAGNGTARREGMSRYPYRAWRKAVFTRDDHTCQDCQVRGGALVAHHVRPWADAPELRYDVDNGVTLCESCHDARHGMERRRKTYACVDCGARKRDGRQPRCRSCGQRHRFATARGE